MYKTSELLLDNGNTLYYKELNGTCYQYAIKLKDGTYRERDSKEMDKIITTLEAARKNGNRIRFWYGDVKTGRSWNEEYDIIGRIGRSCGQDKIPLVLANNSSPGGPAILTDCIVRIDEIKTHRTLYQQANFHVEQLEKQKAKEAINKAGYPWSVMCHKDDGTIQNVANFKTESAADRWIEFINGERYSK